ncbi:MAG: CoA transferase subunit A [Chloroflexi bacterium]|nr:CoA transferase subunit A [Chloroflexota bacterium]
MRNKLTSLSEAIARVPDNAVVALGGNTLHRSPTAAVHELIRQRKRGLNLVKTAGAYDVDILCGAGVASAVSAGFVGYENVFGMAPLYRRAVEQGLVRACEHTCYSVIAGLRAATQGVPFMPVNAFSLSDVPLAQGYKQVADPYSGAEVFAVPAIQPEVAIVHVHEADAEGNARIYGTLFEDVLMVTAAKHVILTAEHIVDGSTFAAQPELTTIAGFMVTHVVHAPRGAHPCSCHGLYDMDMGYLGDFYAQAQTADSFEAFLREHVLDAAYHEMAQDVEREADTLEWSEAALGDVSHRAR